MVKQIGDIKIYSVKDLHEALGVNQRTIRDWFNKGRLRGVKIGIEWHITEDNLKMFLSGEKGGKVPRALKKPKKRKGKEE
jgi:excisionase family DNA binding protein